MSSRCWDRGRRINEGINAHRGGHTAADLVLYGVDFAVIEGFIREEQWDKAAEYLAERARRLERAGAEFLIMATNTMHQVAVELQDAIGIPLIHIVDPTAETATADGANTLGLLGTAPVMEANFYRGRFADFGFEVLVLAEADRAFVHHVIFEELTPGSSTTAWDSTPSIRIRLRNWVEIEIRLRSGAGFPGQELSRGTCH